MLGNDLINRFIDLSVIFFMETLMPLMVVVFFVGIGLRVLIHYTVKRNEWFAKEFEKRVNRFLESQASHTQFSFYVVTKRLLERTFYELFKIRAIMRRRKADYVVGPADRLFMIQHGAAWLVRDTLKNIRFLRHDVNTAPLLDVSKSVFQNNPCFNRVFGVLPASGVNDILNTLPGLFVVGGIFGTFLGIMKALPDLAGIDLSDSEGSKVIIDAFLLKIAFSMGTSILGIILSVIAQTVNVMFNPEKKFVEIIERYHATMAMLWSRSSNNEVPTDMTRFDEHKDELDALSELSVAEEIESKNLGQRAGRVDSGRDDFARDQGRSASDAAAQSAAVPPPPPKRSTG